MSPRRYAESLFWVLVICLAYTSFQSVYGQNQNSATSNANRSGTAADARQGNTNVPGQQAAKPAETTADKQLPLKPDPPQPKKDDVNPAMAGKKDCEKEPQSLDDWVRIDAQCVKQFESYAQKFPSQARLTSSTLPGDGSMAVEVQAKIEPNSKFVAMLSDDIQYPTGLPVEVVWSADQPKAPENQSKSRLTLAVPDLGFSYGNSHLRKLILVSLTEGADKSITKGVAVIQDVKITSRWTSLIESVIAVFIAFLVAVIAVGWYRKKYSLNPVYLTTDKLGKTDISTFQILIFTLLVFGLLLNVLLRTGVLSDISSDILLLLGISAAGATGAAVTDALKTRLSFENWSWLRNHGWLTIAEKGAGKGPEANKAQWSDLLKTDGMFDIYKFQLLIVSFVVALKLLGSDLMSLAGFTIPQNLLGLLGLSNVVHIAGKAVGTSVTELNDKVDKLRVAEKDWVTQVLAAVRAVAGQPAKQQAAMAGAPDKYQTYVTLAKEAARMLQSLYGEEGTKFKNPDITENEVLPEFP